MTPKPEGRIIPTQDEFDSWCEHPVTRFVAESYRVGAEKQRDEWARMFHSNLVPADFMRQRDILKTREDAYMAFLETTLDAHAAIVAGPELNKGSPLGRRPTGERTKRSS